jgi:DNA-binding SARP family transcriptional activator/predicted ATPase
MAAGLEVRLFGGLEIRVDGAPATAFISNKAPALLAYLALVGRPVMRDTLATFFWGEMSDADAKNNLRQALTSLRKQCEPFLEITRESVALRAEQAIWLDVTEFVRQSKAPMTLPAEARIAHLTTAVTLYRGDLLEGVLLRDAPDFEEWVTAQRARLRELALTALHNLVTLQLAEGRFADAIDSATHLLALEPWREEGHRQLMLALAYSGQRSAALAQYDRCDRTLREVFDAAPAEATTALAERIKLALRGPRHNLPAPATVFIGRSEEMRVIQRALSEPTNRLITLIGPGGIGKTRLALQVATERIDRHLGGVWMAPLAPLYDDADIVPAIVEALRIPPLPGDNPLQTLISFLRPRDALLILDNLDHLLTADNLDTISRLLAAAPELQILVASRTRLHLHMERVIEIAGLSYPLVMAEMTDSNRAAIDLFVQCAQKQDAAFALTPQNRDAVIRLCQLVDGMPLALELAAAWIRTLTVAEVVEEIAHSVDFLTSTLRDAAPRHRSLRAVFDSSWRMLTAAEQAAYAGAAVFRGGFDADAARAVIDASPVLLARLRDKSLLRRDADGRFRRHPMLLQFAIAHLQADPVNWTQAARRHVHYFAHMLEQQTPPLYGAAQPVALAAIRRDLDNIWQAWWLAGEQRAFAFFDAVLDAMLLVFDILGLMRTASELCRSAYQQLAREALQTPAARIVAARVQALEGVAEFRLGNFARAHALTTAALAVMAADHAPPWVMGHTHIFLGGAYFGLGDLDRTLAEFHRALDAYTAADSAWGCATALGNIAEMHMVGGAHGQALDYAERAQRLAQPTGNPYLLAHNTYRLAVLLADAGDYPAAQRYQQASLRYAEQLGYASGEGMAMASLGDIAFASGDFAEAERRFADAIEIHRTAGNWMDEAHTLVRQAEATLALEQLETCRTLLHTALRKAVQADAAAVQIDALFQIARLWLRQQHIDDALPLLKHVADAAVGADATRAAASELLANYAGGGSVASQQIPPIAIHAVLTRLSTVADKSRYAGRWRVDAPTEQS